MTTAAFVFILMLACITLAALIAAVHTSGHGHDPGHDDEHGSGGDGGSDRIPRRPLTPPGAGEPTSNSSSPASQILSGGSLT